MKGSSDMLRDMILRLDEMNRKVQFWINVHKGFWFIVVVVGAVYLLR